MTGTHGVLDDAFLADLDAGLAETDEHLERRYPGDPATRQPVHTVYVPAPRFHAALPPAWGSAALAILAQHGGGPDGLAEAFGVEDLPGLHDRVLGKLDREPVEDLRIDFEDGYGEPGDATEDADVLSAARELASAIDRGSAAWLVGIRCKSLSRETRRRGVRTLDLFLAGLLAGADLPAGFVVTLPKVMAVEQVAAFVRVLRRLEDAHALPEGRLRFEIQVETPQSVLAADGRVALPALVSAAEGRCAGLHFGTYDYGVALGVPAAEQSLAHPTADFAKAFMQVAAAGTGVRLSDGSTNLLPVGDRATVRAGWREHARLVRRSLDRGLYQGWDLHPHQLPSRFVATFAFFRAGLPATAARLRGYVDRSDGVVLDEPATAEALARFLLRGLRCGALDEDEVASATTLDRVTLERLARRQPVNMSNSLPPRAGEPT
ncbi:MAG TPA: aldolase [Jiangellaceae bacterium]|nr:aldolase [Jiangellaceae bacterium]